MFICSYNIYGKILYICVRIRIQKFVYVYTAVYESGRENIRNSSQFVLWRKWRLKLGGGVWVCGCVCVGVSG